MCLDMHLWVALDASVMSGGLACLSVTYDSGVQEHVLEVSRCMKALGMLEFQDGSGLVEFNML